MVTKFFCDSSSRWLLAPHDFPPNGKKASGNFDADILKRPRLGSTKRPRETYPELPYAVSWIPGRKIRTRNLISGITRRREGSCARARPTDRSPRLL